MQSEACLPGFAKEGVQAAGGFLDRSLQQYRVGGNLHFSAISAADASEGFEKTGRIAAAGLGGTEVASIRARHFNGAGNL